MGRKSGATTANEKRTKKKRRKAENSKLEGKRLRHRRRTMCGVRDRRGEWHRRFVAFRPGMRGEQDEDVDGFVSVRKD
jgi:hypothetical protein